MKSSKWIKKSLVVLISVLTFGLVAPSDIAWLAENDLNQNPKKDSLEQPKKEAYLNIHYSDTIEETKFDRHEFVESLLEKAEEHSYAKFGPKIGPKIEDEFTQIVLPKIEEAISETAAQFPDEQLKMLAITDKPASGRGERIFHIYNEVTEKDIIRFHVRQENPPQKGYWFSFHYHTYHDQYQNHYELGKIYWDKNTPPKWASSSSVS
jgi:hypothetical protein